MKDLPALRAACKKHGIKIKVQSLSWGPHISFIIDGVSCGSVQSKEFYDKNRDAFTALNLIKQEFSGMKINGQKVYGLHWNA